jgi:hypothetical protein
MLSLQNDAAPALGPFTTLMAFGCFYKFNGKSAPVAPLEKTLELNVAIFEGGSTQSILPTALSMLLIKHRSRARPSGSPENSLRGSIRNCRFGGFMSEQNSEICQAHV